MCQVFLFFLLSLRGSFAAVAIRVAVGGGYVTQISDFSHPPRLFRHLITPRNDERVYHFCLLFVIPAEAGIYPVDEEVVRQQGGSNPTSSHSDGSRNPEGGGRWEHHVLNLVF